MRGMVKLPASRALAELSAHSGWRSRGYLPHLDSGDVVQTIVFRLADSMPRRLLERWREELQDRGDAALRARIAAFEDKGHGACWLACPEVAATVQRALLHFDGKRYRLLEWCVMPNHVHVLAAQMPGHRLSGVVHSWKSWTANRANRLLGRRGKFWAVDYFDRYVRDDAHLESARRYIRENPAKARLCGKPEDWRWSSANARTQT